MLPIPELQLRSHRLNVLKGFHDDDTPQNMGERLHNRLLLAVGEIVEAHNEVRAGHAPTAVYFNPGSLKPEGFGIEIADAVIRLAAICECYGVDLETCIQMKHEYNLTRPYRHGKAF